MADNPAMKSLLEEGRRVVELRASGIARWFEVAFLLFWLAGWAAGEVFGVWILVSVIAAALKLPIHGVPTIPAGGAGLAGAAAMFAFGLLWLSFWTLGGVAAATRVLQMLWGVDRIEWDGAGVRRISRFGPFRRTREFTREEIRAVRFRRGGVALEMPKGAVTLTCLGSRQDHAELRAEIEQALGLAERRAAQPELPQGWESEVDPEGIPVLTRSRTLRRRQAMFVSFLFLVLGTVVGLLIGGARSGSNAPPWVAPAVLGLIATAVGAGAAWLWLGGEALRLRPSHVQVVRWFGSRRWIREYAAAFIRLEHSTDSDGDDWYKLVLRGSAGAKTVASALHDPFELELLGRWIAARLGRELEIGVGVRP